MTAPPPPPLDRCCGDNAVCRRRRSRCARATGIECIASGSAALPLPSLRAQQALRHPLSEPPSVPSGGRRKAPLMAVPLPSLGAQLATSPPPPRDQLTRQSLLSAPRSPLSSKRRKNHSLTCRGRTSLLTQTLVKLRRSRLHSAARRQIADGSLHRLRPCRRKRKCCPTVDGPFKSRRRCGG